MLSLVFAFGVFTGSAAWADLIITGVFDGPLPGGNPKGVELYATQDIPDLASYGLGVANNGGGTDGVETTLPSQPLSAGRQPWGSRASKGRPASFSLRTR